MIDRDRLGEALLSIADLLPRLRRRRREVVHVLQEKRERPDLLVVEGAGPCRHRGPADAVLDLPKAEALGIILDTVRRQLRRLRVEPFSQRSHRCVAFGSAVANRAMLRIKTDPSDQVGVGQRNRIGTLGGLAGQGRVERRYRRQRFERKRLTVRVDGDDAVTHHEVGRDSGSYDRHDKTQQKCSEHSSPLDLFATRARADERAGTVDKVSNQSSGKISGAAAFYNRFEYLDEREAAL